MSACRIQFVGEITKLFDINQLIANAKTAVVVKKRPIAAVAVSRDKVIINF